MDLSASARTIVNIAVNFSSRERSPGIARYTAGWNIIDRFWGARPKS